MAALAMLAAGSAAAGEAVRPTALAADEQPAVVPMTALTAAVAAWTAAALGQPLPAEMPRITFADADEMARLRYGTPAGGATSLVALYDDASRTILLPPDWSGSSPADLSVLVHEMVHHLQNEAGRTFPCPASRESEAFDLQERWLAQFGTRLTSEFDLDDLTLLVLTSCGM